MVSEMLIEVDRKIRDGERLTKEEDEWLAARVGKLQEHVKDMKPGEVVMISPVGEDFVVIRQRQPE